MGIENLKCYECSGYGHMAKDCPETVFAAELATPSRKPPWCAQPGCDRITRLVDTMTDDGEKLVRCRNCHPKGNELPATYIKCSGCRHAVYAWDVRSECGQHQPVGKQLIPESAAAASPPAGRRGK